MAELDYVIFDTETTGMRPEDGHAIVELAAIRVHNRKTRASFDTLVNPGRAVDAEAAAVHGITTQMIARAGKPLIEVIPAFALFAEGATLVGHNIRFDLAFINSHLRQLGLPELDNPLLDTLELAKQRLKLGSYALSYLAKHFKIPQPQAHRAMADVETTKELLFRLLDVKQ